MKGSEGAPLRVAEVGGGIAVAYCGWLLRGMGAEVVRIDLGSATPEAQTLESVDPLFLTLAYYEAGKEAVSSSHAGPVLDGADLIISDDAPRLEALVGSSLEEAARVRPGQVFGVASVFGRTGPLATAPATPLDAQAEASVAFALGDPGRPPLAIPPGILECQAGAHLAAACLMAHLYGGARERIVDIALADVLASYVAVNCRFYIHHGMRWRRAGRRASDSGGAYPFVILPCADGAVCLSGRTRAEWERFVEAMGSPAWAREPRYQKLRAMGQQYPEEVDALISPWLAARTKAEIEAIADKFRLTIAPLRDLADVIATPQLHDRSFLKTWSVGGRNLKGPGLPFRAAAVRGTGQARNEAEELLARASERGGDPGCEDQLLAGLRVLDLGWVWSAPQVGSILAQFGAEVIKVEHRTRPDNSRLSGVIIRDGQRVEGQTTDMSPMFHQINKGKLGITLNLKASEGVDLLKRLAAGSDIVLENMSAGSLERSGLGFDALSAENPRLIMAAMSGAGQFGPLSDMRTYAPTMSSFVGLESLVGYPGEIPTGALNFAIGDPNAAVHALVALFAALERRRATGRGCYIDLSQTETLLATLTPYVLKAQIEGRQPPTAGNAHPIMSPHGFFPAAGEDRWLSIAVRNDDDWAALCGVAEGAPFTTDARFAHAQGRRAEVAALESLLSAWTSQRDRDGLVAALRAAGVPSSPVNDIEGLFSDPQFAARGMAELVDLPGLGPVPLFRAPWNVSGHRVRTGTRGPLLGEHNEKVLRGALGLDEDTFKRLVDEGVIA